MSARVLRLRRKVKHFVPFVEIAKVPWYCRLCRPDRIIAPGEECYARRHGARICMVCRENLRLNRWPPRPLGRQPLIACVREGEK